MSSKSTVRNAMTVDVEDYVDVAGCSIVFKRDVGSAME